MDWQVEYNQGTILGSWLWEATAELDEGNLRLVVMGDCHADKSVDQWPAESLLENQTGDQLAQASHRQHTFVKDFPDLTEAIASEEEMTRIRKRLEEELA